MVYEIYDGAVLVTGAFGAYTIGTNANAAILGSWPALLTVPAPLPVPAKHLTLRCTVDCVVMLHSFDMLAAQATGAYPAGLPTQLYLVAGQLYEIDFPTCLIYYATAGAGGVLYVHAFA